MEKEDKYFLAPKKFNMWIFIFTSFMFFAALTSGFIVYTGGKTHAINIILPNIFMYSTAVIVLSSVTMIIASQAAKRLNLARQRLFLWLTIGLGALFFSPAALRLEHFNKNGGIFCKPKCVAIVYICVYGDAPHTHIIAGLLLLGNTLWGSYRNRPQAKIYSEWKCPVFFGIL